MTQQVVGAVAARYEDAALAALAQWAASGNRCDYKAYIYLLCRLLAVRKAGE